MRIWTPRPGQSAMMAFARERPYCLLLGRPGSGKSMAALTLSRDLEVFGGKVLVVAPTIPARDGWAAEARRWRQTADLGVSHVDPQVLGYKRVAGRLALRDAVATRARVLALPGSVHTVAWNNLFHLTMAMQGPGWPYDVVIGDEAEYVQNHRSQMFQAMKHIAWQQKPARLLLLSGTLASNSPEQLWAPMYLVDKGARLGANITTFRSQFLLPDKVDRRMGRVFSYVVDPEMKDTLAQRMGEVAISVPTPLDCAVVENREYVGLPDAAMKAYRAIERQLMVVLDTGATIEAPNAAVLVGKAQQMASGAVLDSDRTVHTIHTEKLDRLEEMLPSLGPCIVLYQFQHEAAALAARFPQARRVSEPRVIEEFGRGIVPMLLCQFQAASHGIDGLQHGGCNVIIYTPPFSRGLYDQAVARLARPGQKSAVVYVHQLCALRTIDEALYDDVLPGKRSLQEALLSRTWK